METAIGIGILILIVVLYVAMRKANRAASRALNQKVFSRKGHREGQELVAQRLDFRSTAWVDAVRNALLAGVKVSPGIPAMIMDAYLISSSDTQILYGYGNKVNRRTFWGMVQLRPTETGTSGSWEIMGWTLADGVVAGQSVMKRLSADIATSLRSVDPSVSLTTVHVEPDSQKG